MSLQSSGLPFQYDQRMERALGHIVLIKANSLRSINNFLSQTISIDDFASRARKVASPHFVVGSKRRRKSSSNSDIPPYWLFAIPFLTEEKLQLRVPLLIAVDEFVERDVTIPPFWVRQTLCSVETKAVSLIALNAYVSTLGGGHYLCKHIEDAWSMALRQQAVALALGDMELAGQCRIHLAYICMQMGKLKAASRRLELERKFAQEIESHKLLAVVFAAEVYLSKLRSKAAELKKKVHDKLRDEFYRQRFVDVKKTRII